MTWLDQNGALVVVLAVMTLVGYGFSASGWAGPRNDELRSSIATNLLECAWWVGLACSIVAMLVTVAAALLIAWCALWVLFGCLCLLPFILVFGGIKAAFGLVRLPFQIAFSFAGAIMMPLGVLWAVTTVRGR